MEQLVEEFAFALCVFLLVAPGQLRGYSNLDPGAPSFLQQASLQELYHRSIISESKHTWKQCTDQRPSWIEWRQMVSQGRSMFCYQKRGRA